MPETLKTHSDRRIIGLIGETGSGRTTIANLLMGYRQVSVSRSVLVDVLRMLDHVDVDHSGDALRGFVSFWRHEAARLSAGRWLRKLIFDVNRLPLGQKVVVPDIFHPSEVGWIKGHAKGLLIRVVRPGFLGLNSEETEALSTVDMLYPDIPHIMNDGTAQQLIEKVYQSIGKDVGDGTQTETI